MDEDEAETLDAIQAVQNTLAQLDPSALCTGFVAVVEWIEEDGSPSMSMIHSPMPPWHLSGMLNHAQKYHEIPIVALSHEDLEEWGETEE